MHIRVDSQLILLNIEASTQVRNIAVWWRAEMRLILALKCKWVLVPYAEAALAASISSQSIKRHAPACGGAFEIAGTHRVTDVK